MELDTFIKKPAFKMILNSTDGSGIYRKVEKVFKGGIGSGIKSNDIVFSGIAPKTIIQVGPMKKDNKFLDLFGDTYKKIERHRILGAQCLQFFWKHSGLVFEAYSGVLAAFCLMTKKDEAVKEDLSNALVGCVTADELFQLHLSVQHIKNDKIYYARHRYKIISPDGLIFYQTT